MAGDMRGLEKLPLGVAICFRYTMPTRMNAALSESTVIVFNNIITVISLLVGEIPMSQFCTICIVV